MSEPPLYASAVNWSELQTILRARIQRQAGLQAEIAQQLDLPVARVTAYVTQGQPIPTDHLDAILSALSLELDLQGSVREGELTRQNLTATDPVIAVLMTLQGSVPQPMRPGDVFDAMEIQIPDPRLGHLPSKIVQYIDLGRACVAYSGYWYPLLTLAVSQLGRAAEAALRCYAVVQGLPVTTGRDVPVSMHKLIEQLHRRGHLDADQKQIWMRWNNLRNDHAHAGPKVQYSLGMVYPVLTSFTDDLLRLLPAAEKS